ncbi:toll/interleukin-1 receptor domain-containing protein [Kitasatospora sp. MMS16-BH015]|uniref:toll/interleukin-1 receptor domain-containing protein n=1 Tax=Kitasatospora sp. MMS16-BH015 TaxID=2018025 RepID=UPI00131A5E59|nr:toll/interleukin-1 receptor domain-containing protein [Kitasatospora sp. MMS16-BH015]
MSDPWGPERVERLRESLALLKGEQIESFFDDHGLGDAYRRPSGWSSKLLKVEAAFAEAFTRGEESYRAFLGEVEDFRERSAAASASGRPKAAGNDPGRAPEHRMIFISHSSEDGDVARWMTNLLVLGGMPRRQIFCSSERSTGIPSGEGIRTYLRRMLMRSDLVIELISKSFLERPFCVMEMGAAWVLERSTIPVVVPPLTLGEVTGKLGDLRLELIGDDMGIDSVLDELHGRLVDLFDVHPSLAEWNAAARDFKQQWADRPAALGG